MSIQPSTAAAPNLQDAETLAAELFHRHLDSVHRQRDRVFAWLMGIQWVFGVAIALLYSPYGWAGKIHSPHLHVYYALLLGGALSIPIFLLARFRPGSAITRHAVAVAQMLWSALLIHLTGGRIETHFHVFGSLAFLAFYRDWKVLLTGTIVVAGDHLIRGLMWPESVYGLTNPEWWRFLEHAFWVIFENVVLVMGILENLREMKALAARQAETELLNQTIEQKVVERTQELQASREEYRSLVETTRTIPWRMDASLERFSYVGPQGGSLLRCAANDWLEDGFWNERLHPDDRASALDYCRGVREGTTSGDVEFRLRRGDGEWIWVRCMASVAENGRSSSLTGVMLDRSCLTGVFLDVTERRKLEFELQQAQKLESVGRLAAGVAHEINTPIQFVNDSVHFVREGFAETLDVLHRYQAAREAMVGGVATPALLAELVEAEEAADLAYLEEKIPRALDRSVDGLERVATLVRSMKEFAHPDRKEQTYADLNRALEATLTIARNEYKYVAELDTDFGDLPPVLCHVSEVNQAFLNIVVNAAHAIGDKVRETEQKGRIQVTTRLEGDCAVIRVSDTGGGIPVSVRSRVFDPFFTTKEVGKGTGQGLSIARNVVVEKHGGTLEFEVKDGFGTTFAIGLPVTGKPRVSVAEAA